MFPDLDDSLVGKIFLKSLMADFFSFNTSHDQVKFWSLKSNTQEGVDICSLMNFRSIIFCFKHSLTYFEQAKDGVFLVSWPLFYQCQKSAK